MPLQTSSTFQQAPGSVSRDHFTVQVKGVRYELEVAAHFARQGITIDFIRAIAGKWGTKGTTDLDLVIGHKVYKIKRIYVALASIEKLKLWAAKAQAWARKNGEDGVELFITVPLGVEKVSYTKAFDEIMDEFDMVKISWFRDVPHL